MLKFNGKDAFAQRLPPRPMFEQKVVAGRWFTAGEAAGERCRRRDREEPRAERPGRTSATASRSQTASGPARLRVVGMTSTQWNNGLALPDAARDAAGDPPQPGHRQRLLGAHELADHGAIDRTTTALEDRLAAAGYAVGTNVKYVDQARNVDANRQISSAIGILGFLIVAISMVGLVNAITMSVLERTREIGVLRCIGARARDIRRIFAAEGLAVSLAGWLLGIPVGYALARLFNWLLLEVVGIEFAFTFPPLNLLIALVGTVVLALLIMRIPLRRAVRFKPGEALRYA